MARAFTYEVLRDIIGREYNGEDDAGDLDAQSARDVERILADGLERFYDPEIVPPDAEKHQWSFLKPTVRLEFRSGVYVYDLPKRFAMLDGPITYPYASAAIFPQLEVTSPERLLYYLQRNEAGGRPQMAAVRVKDTTDIHETAYELLTYPVPDDDYEAYARIKIDPTIIGEDDEIPLGGQPHRQTVIAACMSALEDFNQGDGRWHNNFMRRLAASISHDRQVNCPHSLGANEDRSDYQGLVGDWRDRQSYLVTYNGSVIE